MADFHQNQSNAPRQAPPVSVVILTFNEEQNIAECIASCSWCRDVHVLDSGSTDRTREIAQKMGATVHVNKFVSFGQQRNWAIDNVRMQNKWHFHLDADERFTPQLVNEMAMELGPSGRSASAAAFHVPSKMIFLGKWLRYSAAYPTYQVRLFNSERCRFVDVGHGQREQCTGPVPKLRQPYLHYNFSKGLNEWLNKHNHYSTREASEGIAIRNAAPISWTNLFTRDATLRRRTLKSLSFRIRGRAMMRFFYMYFGRFGWLDASPGFHYSAMISMYEYWIELKMREQNRDWHRQTTALARRLLEESRP